MSHTTFTVPPVNEPPRRHDITIRDASILSAHTAEEIICVVSVPAVTGVQAVAVALAVVADALSAGDPQLSPNR